MDKIDFRVYLHDVEAIFKALDKYACKECRDKVIRGLISDAIKELNEVTVLKKQ